MNFKGMDKVADLMVINLLFVLCSLPVVTIGASATAMHYCLRRWREGEGNLAKDFLKSFKLNLRQATVLWCAFAVIAAAVAVNFRLISLWSGSLFPIVFVMLIVVSAVLLAWVSVVFPMLARFDDTTGKIAKNALLIAVASPLRSLIAAALNLLPVVLAVIVPGIFLILSVLWLGLLCSSSGFAVQLLFSPVFDQIRIKSE